MDDVRAGRLLRALRLRAGLTQKELGALASVSQQQISRLERGHFRTTDVRLIRAVFAELDASVEWQIAWRGGTIDRLLDERHARLGSVLAERLAVAGWTVVPEVTYSVYGERGSIDLLAWHDRSAAALVVEVKSELTSIEATLRKHDEKVRHAPAISIERFGRRPRTVGRLLVLPDGSTERRRVQRADALLGRAYPIRGAAVREWLRRPDGALGGLLFLADTTRGS